MKKHARRLRGWRKRVKLTQKEAAKWYGCTERAWQRYEAGDRRVPLPLFLAIARYDPDRDCGKE